MTHPRTAREQRRNRKRLREWTCVKRGINRFTTSRDGGAMNATLTSPELTRADRCDRCGAAARVRATLPSGAELLFCQHHANEHEAKLIEMAAVLEISPADPVGA